MDNSRKFFANKECEFYPCHTCREEINCLFCYCPLYHMDCPGNYRMVERGGKTIKSCIDCTFPHEAENYEIVVALLRENL